MSHVTASVLYNVTSGTPLMGQGVTAVINCERLNAFSPRAAWIKPQYNPGDGTVITYTTTAEPNDPEIDANSIKGWMIQQDDATLIIDAVTGQAIVDACGACCGPTGIVVAPFYTSGVPAFTYPVSATYCITRADDGSAYAHEILTEDYVYTTVGGARLRTSTGTSSTYQVEAFGAPPAVGTDTVAAGACA